MSDYPTECKEKGTGAVSVRYLIVLFLTCFLVASAAWYVSVVVPIKMGVSATVATIKENAAEPPERIAAKIAECWDVETRHAGRWAAPIGVALLITPVVLLTSREKGRRRVKQRNTVVTDKGAAARRLKSVLFRSLLIVLYITWFTVATVLFEVIPMSHVMAVKNSIMLPFKAKTVGINNSGVTSNEESSRLRLQLGRMCYGVGPIVFVTGYPTCCCLAVVFLVRLKPVSSQDT